MPSFPLTVEGQRVHREVFTYKDRNVYVNESSAELPEAPARRWSSRSRTFYIGWDSRGPERRYALKVEGSNNYGSEIGEFESYVSGPNVILWLRDYAAGKVAIRIAEELALCGEPIANFCQALRRAAEEEGLI